MERQARKRGEGRLEGEIIAMVRMEAEGKGGEEKRTGRGGAVVVMRGNAEWNAGTEQGEEDKMTHE
jgi:hypothetical protein